ncbi:hypothetical protein KSS87_022307 [Heliosperma pusillum]|nr:hypothetical protein KSS87_022307 [Heliosperma pusillum]
MGLPWLGESLDFLTAMRNGGKPEIFIFNRLTRYYGSGQLNGVFKTRLFGNNVVAMAGTTSNKLIFSNENKLVTMWWPPFINKAFPSSNNKLSINEDFAKKKIKQMQIIPNFLTKTEWLKRYVPLMDDCTRRHIAAGAWGPSERIEAYTVAKHYTFNVACRVFMSIEAQDDPDTVASLFDPFNVLLTGILSFPVDLPGTKFNRAVKASKKIREKIGNIIKKRRMDMAEGKAAPAQDILSHILESPIDPKYLNDFDLASMILGLLTAGQDTSSNIITFIFKYLAECPLVYEAVYKEQIEIARAKEEGELLNWEDIQKMKYSWCVACEVLRLAPAVQATYRVAITDFMYNGFLIPKGWKIYWSTHSTHRSPECFPDPERFDPTRFEGQGPAPYSFVPFGGGPRMCPGKEYARLTILTFMHNIVTRFKWETLLPDEKIIISPIPRPEHNLPLRIFSH